MGGKDYKHAGTSVRHHAFEFVNCQVLSLLLGRAPDSIVNEKEDDVFHPVGFTYVGSVRKYSFTDAAKLAYPELTNYEIARLRVDINERILEGRKRNKAEKFRSEEK